MLPGAMGFNSIDTCYVLSVVFLFLFLGLLLPILLPYGLFDAFCSTDLKGQNPQVQAPSKGELEVGKVS